MSLRTVLDDEDLHLREEVQREVIHGVAQDRLLDQQHVAPAGLHLCTREAHEIETQGRCDEQPCNRIHALDAQRRGAVNGAVRLVDTHSAEAKQPAVNTTSRTTAALSHLLADVEDVPALLLQDAVHLAVVGDDHLVLQARNGMVRRARGSIL